jgi:hypothetical protein
MTLDHLLLTEISSVFKVNKDSKKFPNVTIVQDNFRGRVSTARMRGPRDNLNPATAD